MVTKKYSLRVYGSLLSSATQIQGALPVMEVKDIMGRHLLYYASEGFRRKPTPNAWHSISFILVIWKVFCV